MTALRGLRVLTVAGALLGAGTAQAQSTGAEKLPPVRATSTVEVIDVGRGVEDIISRVRAQQRAQGTPAPLENNGTSRDGKGPSGARGPGQQAGKPQAGNPQAGNPQAGNNDERVHAEDLRSERPERPRARLERDRRDGHHLDRDAGRRGQAERARENRK